MNNIKSNPFLFAANFYILLSLAYYWVETSSVINPIAIALLVVFALHLFVAKGLIKLVFPSVFIALNLYMFLALFSEFREFPTLTNDALILMVVGIVYLGLNVISAVIMISHYAKPAQLGIEA